MDGPRLVNCPAAEDKVLKQLFLGFASDIRSNKYIEISETTIGCLCCCVFPISHFVICYETQLTNAKIRMSKKSRLSRANTNQNVAFIPANDSRTTAVLEEGEGGGGGGGCQVGEDGSKAGAEP